LPYPFYLRESIIPTIDATNAVMHTANPTIPNTAPIILQSADLILP
jgi:hypothetical protein